MLRRWVPITEAMAEVKGKSVLSTPKTHVKRAETMLQHSAAAVTLDLSGHVLNDLDVASGWAGQDKSPGPSPCGENQGPDGRGDRI